MSGLPPVRSERKAHDAGTIFLHICGFSVPGNAQFALVMVWEQWFSFIFFNLILSTLILLLKYFLCMWFLVYY